MRQVQFIACSVFATLIGVATLASATPITIANQSFETPAELVAGDTATARLGPDADYYGWNVFNPGTACVIVRPVPLSTLAVVENQVGGAAFDGLNDFVCYSPNSELDIRQTLGTKYEANKTYTLSTYVGQFSVGQYRGYEMGLATANDGSYIAGVCDNTAHHSGGVWTTGMTPGAGTWAQVTTQFTTGASGGPIGQNIMVRFGTAGLAGARTAFDLVTLDVQSVPEPSSLILLTGALLGLICYAWRKR